MIYATELCVRLNLLLISILIHFREQDCSPCLVSYNVTYVRSRKRLVTQLLCQIRSPRSHMKATIITDIIIIIIMAV